MTESEWLRADEPQTMLESLRDSENSSERKRRLFVCACCRVVWALMDERRSRKAVELAERHADGDADEDDWRGVLAAAFAVTAPHGVEYAVAFLGARSLDDLSDWPGYADQIALASLARHHTALDNRRQWDLLREVYGVGTSRPVGVHPAWRTPTVRALAERAYLERQLPAGTLDASLLRVLADALEEAGCDDEEVLGHLRQQGVVHVRGCWVVDAALGWQ